MANKISSATKVVIPLSLIHIQMCIRDSTWYGMTYHEDVAAVKGSFKEMLENGVYKADLFSDL